MNIAAERIAPATFATRQHEQQVKSKQITQKIILVFLVLASAFFVVYVKDLNRRMFMFYQTLQDQQAQIYVDWGKLLLEQTTWSTQSRIQQVATQRLGMQVPDQKQVVIVKE